MNTNVYCMRFLKLNVILLLLNVTAGIHMLPNGYFYVRNNV